MILRPSSSHAFNCVGAIFGEVRLAGVSGDDSAFTPAGESLRKRLPWLAVNLVTAFLAAAVVALFLFIVMLLDAKGDVPAPLHKIPLFARIMAFALVGLGLVSFLSRGQLPSPDLATTPALGSSLKLYAYQLFTVYLLPVQILGFLLLIAMLGVIVLSKKFEGMDDIK